MPTRILILEDDPDNAHVMEVICERAGYSVVVAGNGERGLALMEQTPIDLVLLDIRMPGLDGAEVLRRMRRDRRLCRIPVIIQTAQACPERLQSLRALGPEGLLVKPFLRCELLRAIEQVLLPLSEAR